MSSCSRKSKVLEAVALGSALVAVTALVAVPGKILSLVTGTDQVNEVICDSDGAAWWDNVGGCGVSGASGGGGGGAKWMGRGVTGGLVDMQLMSSITMGGDYYYKSFSARYSSKFFNKLNAGISFPWSIKEGTYQYDNNESSTSQMINGFGNLGLDASYSFGETENMSVAWNLGLPTGRYDHRRADRGLAEIKSGIGGLKDTLTSLVTPELQPGNGLFSTGISFEYAVDKDWGPMTFGVSYSASFLNLGDLIKAGAQNDVWDDPKNYGDISKRETEYYNIGILYPMPLLTDSKYFIDSSTQDVAQFNSDLAEWTTDIAPRINDSLEVENQYYVRDEDNERSDELHGDFFGNSIGVNFAIGYKEESCVHSFAASYSYKLALDWYVRRADTDVGLYSPSVDAETLTKEFWIKQVESGGHHSLSLAYGLEISNMDFPVFLAGAAAFTEDGFSNVSGTVGVKGSFF